MSAYSDARPPGARELPGHRPARLVDAFDPQDNALSVLRLFLAGLVAVTHAFSVGFGHQPAIGDTDVADLAVDGFFVLSGFLVARSWLRLGSLRRFAWHRFLRLMPAFWTCLVLTAVVAAPVAAALAGRDPQSVFTGSEEPAWRYVLVNSLLPMLQYGIGDVPDPLGGGPAVFDGSLWTLQYEAFCYAVLAVLGAASVLRRRLVLLGLVGVVWLLVLMQAGGLIPFDVPVFDNDRLLRFLFVFLLGAAAHVCAERIRVHRVWAGVAMVSVIASLLLLEDYRPVGGIGLAYLCLYAAVRLPWRPNPRWDLSYGLYIYHWPVQLLLALAGAVTLGEWAFAALSIAGALFLASLSWVLVESPALRQKDAAWVDRRTARRPDPHAGRAPRRAG